MEFLKRLFGQAPATPPEAEAPTDALGVSARAQALIENRPKPARTEKKAAQRPAEDEESSVLLYRRPDGEFERRPHGRAQRAAVSGIADESSQGVPPEGGMADGRRPTPPTPASFETPAPTELRPLERFWWIRRQFGLVSGSRQSPYVEEAFRQGGDDVVLFLVGISATVSRLLYQKTAKGWNLACVLEVPARSTGLHAPLHVFRFNKTAQAGAPFGQAAESDANDVLLARLSRKPGEERPPRGRDGLEWPDLPPLTKSIEKRIRSILAAVPGHENLRAPETARIQRAIPDADELRTPDMTRISADAFDFLHPDYVHYDPRLAHFRNVVQEQRHVRLGDVCEISFEDEEWPTEEVAAISLKTDPFRKMHFDLSRLPTLGIKCLYLRSRDPQAFPREYLAMFAGTWFFTAHCVERSISRRPELGLTLSDLENVFIPVPTKLAKRVARRYWNLREKSEMFQHLELGSFREQAVRADPMAVHAEDFLLVARHMPDPRSIFRSRDMLAEFERFMGAALRTKVGECYLDSAGDLGSALEALVIDWLMELNDESLNVYAWPNKARWGEEYGGSVTLWKLIVELRDKHGLGSIFEKADLIRNLRNLHHAILAAKERNEKERLEKERQEETALENAAEDGLGRGEDDVITLGEIEAAMAAMDDIIRIAHEVRGRPDADADEESDRYRSPGEDKASADRSAAALLHQLRVRTPPPEDYDGSSVTPYRGTPIRPQ